MRALLVYLLVGAMVIWPVKAIAQADEDPEPGPTAASVLPKADVFGEGWTESDVISPDVIQEYGFTMSPDVFKEGAAGIYLGPSGTRAIVVSFILTDNRIAIRKSWEDASSLMDVINYPVSTDYDRDQELESMPAPEGCLEAKRVEGAEKTFQLPSGSTLCAVDDASLLLVTVFGEVNGAAGVDASDAVVSAVTSGSASDTTGGKETPAPGGAGATEIAVETMDVKFEPRELTIPANTDVTITVTNKGVLQHDFVIEGEGVESGFLDAGKSADVVVNLPPGTYTFICTEAGHKEAGMVGTLIVGDGVAASPTETTTTDTGGTAFIVSTEDIKFEPKELTIPANTDVTITVSNDGVLQHDFEITDQGIKTSLLNSGDSEDVVINLPPGTYQFVCTVPGHKEAGMIGTLIVE